MRSHDCCNGETCDAVEFAGRPLLCKIHRVAGSVPDHVPRDPGRRCVCWRLTDCCNYCLTPCPTRMIRHPPLAALLGVAPLPFVAACTANNVALVAKAQQRRGRGARGAGPSSQFPSWTTAPRFPVTPSLRRATCAAAFSTPICPARPCTAPQTAGSLRPHDAAHEGPWQQRSTDGIHDGQRRAVRRGRNARCLRPPADHATDACRNRARAGSRRPRPRPAVAPPLPRAPCDRSRPSLAAKSPRCPASRMKWRSTPIDARRSASTGAPGSMARRGVVTTVAMACGSIRSRQPPESAATGVAENP